MVALAVLHETLPAYMEKTGNSEENKHFRMVYHNVDPDIYRREAGATRPDVLILDLNLLGPEPVQAIEKIEREINPEATVIVYSFTKWSLLESLRGDGRHIIRAPVSVRALRASLVNLIVRDIMSGGNPSKDKTTATAATGVPAGSAPRRQYSEMQLARLQEIRTEVDCECPNQVADLIINLNAFEDYSKHCENKNEADAKVHAMLYRATGHARAIMESAMQELLEFEKIDIIDTPEVPPTGSAGR